MNNKIKSIILDLIQIGSLLSLVFSGPILPLNSLILTLQILAAVLIAVAVWEMRRNRFYRVPDVGKQDRLVTSGVYHYIRHPMYASQILFTATLLANYFSFFRLSIFILLFVNFLFKIEYEERLLSKHFPDYQDYEKKSFRLIPYLY